VDRIILSKLAENNTKSTMFVFLLTALCCFNVIYFLSVAANPLINADAWYFLDINIRKWVAQGFDWDDLFVKRNVVDHAQPLNKFFLYINYRFFNLDFRFESLIGLIGLFSIIFFFVYRFLSTLFINIVPIGNIIAFSMAMLIITSLNATGLYTWSLVTFSFLPLAIAFACAWFTWSFLQNKNVVLSLLFLLFSMLAIGDTAAIILWTSIFGSIALIFVTKASDFRKRAIVWLLASGALVGALFLAINWNFIFVGNGGATAKASQLQLTNPNFYIEAIRIIFSSSIIHGVHLTNFGNFSNAITWLFAVPIFYFYVKHFFDLLLKKKDITEMDFLVTFMLVYASVSIAAIIFGRVSEYGINYLNQPRYLVIYQLIPFSLFIKWAFSENNSPGKYNNYYLLTTTTTLIILLIIQFFVSLSAYRSVPWVWKWHMEQTNVINKYINDPTIASGNCTPHSSPICNLPINKRNDLLKLMQSARLNLFNPNFQNTYRLFLDVKTIEKNAAKP
jgi:hypothetical protein